LDIKTNSYNNIKRFICYSKKIRSVKELSTYEIANQFHASRIAIRSWKVKYLETGMDALFSETRGRNKMK